MKHLYITKRMLAVSLFLLVFASVNVQAQDTIWYVNGAVATSGDGTTPANAVKTIPEAIALALANTETSDTIRVAAGTYTNADFTNDIDIETSMTLTGSWNAAFTATNLEATPTIVDLNSQIQFIHAVNRNRWVVENMIIRRSSSTEDGNTDEGGAMRIQNGGDCIVRNVIFDRCSGLYENGISGNAGSGAARGGGVFVVRSGTRLLVEDCIFLDNFSVAAGGVVKIRSGGANTFTANRCLFVGNKAVTGAVIHTDGSEGGTTITLTNSIFRENYGSTPQMVVPSNQGSGPSQPTNAFQLASRTIRIRNCTFVGNNSEADLFQIINGQNSGRLFELTNNIFLDNQFAGAFVNLATPEDWETTHTQLVQYNLLDNNAAEPLDFAGASLVGVNNNFLGTAALLNPSANIYTPLGTSDAIDAGLTIADITDDYEGDSRPQGAGYDIGAIEGAFDPGATSVNHWTIY